MVSCGRQYAQLVNRRQSVQFFTEMDGARSRITSFDDELALLRWGLGPTPSPDQPSQLINQPMGAFESSASHELCSAISNALESTFLIIQARKKETQEVNGQCLVPNEQVDKTSYYVRLHSKIKYMFHSRTFYCTAGRRSDSSNCSH